MKKTIFSSASLVLLLVFFAAMALAVFPFTPNFIVVSKNFVFFFSALLITGLYVLHSIRQKSFELVLSPLTIPAVVFGVAVLASTFFTNAYPVEGLLGMGGVYLAYVMVIIFASALLSKKHLFPLLTGFGVITAVLVFFSALELSSFGPADLLNQVFGLAIPSSILFNLSGSTLVALQLVLLAAVGMIGHLVATRTLAKPFAVLQPILLIGIALFAWSLLPGKPASPTLPSFSASWSVMLDTLHNPRAALIGVGPASFGNSYLQFKPLWVNGTATWAVPFVQGANTPLTLITTLGFFGFFAWSWLVIRAFREIKKISPEGMPFAWMLGLSIIMQLVLPPSSVLLAAQALCIVAIIVVEKHRHSTLKLAALEAHIVSQRTEESRSALPISTSISGVVLLLAVVVGMYVTGRAYAGYYYMGLADAAAAQNDAITVYQLQGMAIEMNPYIDEFRRSYANTNIIIAAALSNKAEPTQDDQERSSALIQQAIQEARSATLLDPNDTQNWLVLAQIYSNLIGTVDEAEQWAIQAYIQAIETNPNDPNTRIALGGVFISQQDFQQAASIFQQAIQIKGDHANSYYNLAFTLKQLQQYADAKQVMNVLLSLIPEDTDDFVTITQEIEELDKLIAENGTPSAELSNGNGQQVPSLVDQQLQQPNAVNANPNTLNLSPDEELAPTSELPDEATASDSPTDETPSSPTPVQ